MHRRILLPVLIIVILATINSTAKAQDQNWSMLEGRLRITVPASWQPMTPDEAIRYSSGPVLLQAGLLAPDGVTGLGLALTELPDKTMDIRSLKASLVYGYRDQGWQVMLADIARISNQNFVILHCRKNVAGLPVVNLIAATHLEGKLLSVPFLTAGKDTDEVLLPLQLALMTLEIIDGPDTAANDDNVRILPHAEAVAPGEASDRTVIGLPRTISGTGVTLDVPDAFVQAMLLPGYFSADGLAGLYVTTSGLPYAMARHFLDREALRRRGMELQKTESLEVDGRPATLCLASYSSNEGPGQTLLLLVGDHEKSRLIHAELSSGAPLGMKQVLRAALLSVTWDPSQNRGAMEGLGFTLSETQSLKILCRAHDQLVLAVSGSQVPLDRSEPYAVVSISGLGQAVDSLLEVATWWTENTPTFADFSEESRKERMFGEHEGVEIIGTVVDNQTKKRRDFYQALVRIDAMYCVVQGFMNAYAATDLTPEFARLATSLRLSPVDQPAR